MAKSQRSNPRARRYWRITLWSVIGIVVAALLLPLTGYIYVGMQSASAQTVTDTNPRSNYWRTVRGGNAGYSAVSGKPEAGVAWLNRETNVLMNGSGQNWRQLRNGVLANWGGWIVFLVALAIMAFFVFKGRIQIEGGKSGEKILRWTPWERFVHWTTATAFVVLAATGLSLFFGRALLIPLLGSTGFSTWAGIAQGLHGFFGPWVFAPGVALMIIMWIAHNLPSKEDMTWLTSGGGIVGSGHASAGRMNAGEKLWFWFICTVGVACIVTGVILAYPVMWEQTRNTMQLSNLIHGASALAFVAFWLGHAYIGTVGSEGSLDAMSTGYVDVNWAKQHHDLWYQQVLEAGDAAADGSEDATVAKEQLAT